MQIHCFFKLGLFLHPMEEYLQNLFCDYLGVEIIRPFQDLNFQKKLWGSRPASRYLGTFSDFDSTKPNFHE